MPVRMRRRLDRTGAICVRTAALLAMLCWALAATKSAADETNPAPGTAKKADARQPQASAPKVTADEGSCGAKKPRRTNPAHIAPVDLRRVERPSFVKKNDTVAKGPPPKWACPAQTITLDPVWKGKPIKATWEIRNGGTGDLTIKLKGG